VTGGNRLIIVSSVCVGYIAGSSVSYQPSPANRFRDWAYSDVVFLFGSFGLSVIALGAQSALFVFRKP
jgi:hypothetical protein